MIRIRSKSVISAIVIILVLCLMNDKDRMCVIAIALIASSRTHN